MDNVVIEWEEVEDNDNIKESDDTYFYAFTQNNLFYSKLIYIGIAYHQDVADEIYRTIKRFDYNIKKIKIWLGYIEKSDYNRITKSIVRDIESLLICGNEPEDNVQCKDNYTGRDNLKIKNNGCKQIKSVKCKDCEVTLNKWLL
jgi:hypothetical protein